LSDTKRRFRIAFSFAGEQRPFVAEVARHLADRLGEEAILYDKYHEAEFARRDLGVYLPELYHKQSGLVVAVICPEYDEKEWTGLEWTAIHDLLKQRRDEEVMLCRFERAAVTGLYSSGFVDLDDKTPEQTATLILERLALNEGKPKNYYNTTPQSTSSPATTSIPNNLPRLQTFFGRTEELKQIAEALDHSSRTWGALIDGPGGMGKTSLAVRAAYDCPPSQFKRIIFLSVKDRELDDDGERQLGTFILPGFLEMLNELARELGKPDIAKSPESERIRLIIEALTSTRTLLILDNLESLTKADRDQLFTFVKRLPQGSKAILTSRRRIGSSADVLILSNLDEAAALQTLADLATHNPLLAKTNESERRSLYMQTGGNPLLLRWTAGQIGRGSCRSIADALAFLRSCPQGNDPLEFVFGDLAREFTDDETKVLVALIYFNLPTAVNDIGTVAGSSEQTTESALRTLANRSLVVPDQEENAFSLVPMVADFLRRTRPDVVANTASLLEQRAYGLIVENGYEHYDRFEVLDAAWPIITAALPLFMAGSNERLQTVCDALRHFLDFTIRWDEWLSLEQQGLARAETVNQSDRAAQRAYRSGWVYHQRGEGDSVLACANRAARHWDAIGAGPIERATALRLRGLGYFDKSDYEAAISAHRQALDLVRELGTEHVFLSAVLTGLARAEDGSGNSVDAEQHYREALALVRTENSLDGIATCVGNLADMMIRKRDWKQAETFAREGLSIAEKVGRQQLVAANDLNLARALIQQEKHEEALPHAQRALLLFEQMDIEPYLTLARRTFAACEPKRR
jgi:tetratricopeptide (TPR) repeat protein